jgi:cation diffusion facilitator CzcD-associated flavoprotein CzcO
MLQRSPTFFRAARNADDLADTLRRLEVDESWIHEIVRRKILHDQDVFTRRSFEEPEKVRNELLAGVRAHLGPDFDMATHFTPSYRPWRQRIAFVPDGDLFKGIRSGKASVVTDEIDRFTETGIRLKSGRSSRRTSSSRPPASISMRWATSPSRSTASRSISATPSPIAA